MPPSYCFSCGTRLEPKDAFCTGCGRSLVDAAADPDEAPIGEGTAVVEAHPLVPSEAEPDALSAAHSVADRVAAPRPEEPPRSPRNLLLGLAAALVIAAMLVYVGGQGSSGRNRSPRVLDAAAADECLADARSAFDAPNGLRAYTEAFEEAIKGNPGTYEGPEEDLDPDARAAFEVGVAYMEDALADYGAFAVKDQGVLNETYDVMRTECESHHYVEEAEDR